MTFYAGETVVWTAEWLDEDDKPVVADPTQGVTLQVMTEDELTELLAEAAMSIVAEDLGNEVTSATATSGTSLTLTDTNRSWKADVWRDAVVRITAGTGIGQQRRIRGNAATVLTVTKAWSVTPDATSVYMITRRNYTYSWLSPTAQAGKTVVGIVRAKDDTYKSAGKCRVKLEAKI